MKSYLSKNTKALFAAIIVLLTVATMFFSPTLRAADVIIGTGNAGTQTGATYGFPFNYWYNGSWNEMLYPASYLSSFGMQSGTIHSLSIQLVSRPGMHTNWGGCRIRISNTNLTTLPNPTRTTELTPPNVDYTLVFDAPVTTMLNNPAVGSWITFTFNAPFVYTGGGLVVALCNYGGAYTSGSYVYGFRATSGFAAGSMVYHQYADGITSTANCGTSVGGVVSSITQSLDMRFNIDMDPPGTEYYFRRLNAAQSTIISVMPGSLNVPIINAQAAIGGNAPNSPGNAIQVAGLTFDSKGSYDKLTSARLYYTANDGTFSTTTLVGTIPEASLTNTLSFTLASPITLSNTMNYNFWLVYDIKKKALHGQTVDAAISSITLQRSDGTPIPVLSSHIGVLDPSGVIDIVTQQYVYTGPMSGTVPQAATDDNYGLGYYYNLMQKLMTYTAEDMSSNTPGTITNMALWGTYNYNPTYDGGPYDSTYVLMRNSPNSTLIPSWPTLTRARMTGTTGGTYAAVSLADASTYLAEALADGWTIVKGPFNLLSMMGTTNPYNQWLDFTLDTEFDYDGGNLDVMFLKFYWREYYAAATRRYGYFASYGSGARYGYAYISQNPMPTPPSSANNCYRYPYAPYHDDQVNYMAPKNHSRFYIDYVKVQSIKEVTVTQVDGLCGVGAQNQAILGLNINTKGIEEPYLYLRSIRYNGKGSYSNGQILNAKLYCTRSATFNTDNLVAGPITINASNVGDFVLASASGHQLEVGDNYFWLTYDIHPNESVADQQIIDAEIISFDYYSVVEGVEEVTTISAIDNNDPANFRTIRAPLSNGVYYVGVGVTSPDPLHSYASLALCAQEASQIGFTKNTEIRIISNLSETATAEFGAAPFGDNIQVTMVPYKGSFGGTTYSGVYTIANNTAGSAIKLAGIKHFYLEGSSDGVSGTTRDFTFNKSSNGITIEVVAAEDIKLRNFNVAANNATNVGNDCIGGGSSNLVTINNVKFTKANRGIAFTNSSSNIVINNNEFGTTSKTTEVNSLGNAISLLGGTNNTEIFNNKILNIAGATDSVSAIQIRGTAYRQNLNNRIFNNNIGNVLSTNSTAMPSAFRVDNCSGVSIYHNTVLLSQRGVEAYNTIFYSKGGAYVRSLNNLLSNTITTEHPVFMVVPDTAALFEISDYNLYNAGSASQMFTAQPSGIGSSQIGTWQSVRNLDLNSAFAVWDASYLSTTDYHLNGDICGSAGTLVPMLNTGLYPSSNVDMDGQRGQDTRFPNMTTAGADEVLMSIIADPEIDLNTGLLFPDDLPTYLIICEDEQEPVQISRKKIFGDWLDGIDRDPFDNTRITNTWYNTAGDVLTLDDNGYRTDIFPYLYIYEPTYKQTTHITCVTLIGYAADSSTTCDFQIMKAPEITVPDDDTLLVNINSLHLMIDADVYGSAASYVWQRRPVGSTQWINVAGQTTESLDYIAGSVALMEGTYRLRATSFTDQLGRPLCNAEQYYYSREMEIRVGYPLTDVGYLDIIGEVPEQNIGYQPAIIDAEICMGDEFWFEAGTAVGDPANIMGYIWEKQAMNGDWEEISSVVNASAIQPIYTILSSRSEDEGRYRCRVLGIEHTEMITPIVNLTIKKTSVIRTQPVETAVCEGSSLYELSDNILKAIIEEPQGVVNEYRWYKNGELLTRVNENGDVISKLDDDTYLPSDTLHSLYFWRRTDTTWLPIQNIRFEDAGRYKLEMIYINCDGQLDSKFSDEVNLFVYGPSEIIGQSQDMRAISGGYIRFFVDVVTPGASTHNPLTYQWYRHYGSGAVMPMVDDHRINGSRSPIMTIVNVKESDMSEQNASDYYYCVIKGLCNPTEGLVTDPIDVQFVPDINIIVQPEIKQELCESNVATFTIEAKATDVNEPVSYRWHKDGAPVTTTDSRITGWNTPILTITDLQTTDAGTYYADVNYTNMPTAAKVSDNSVLEVIPSPRIVSIQSNVPNDSTIEDGSFTLSVTTEDPDGLYNYQWYFIYEGVAIALGNANGESYSVSKVSVDDAGQYYCVITSVFDCGMDVSDTLVMKIGGTGIEENTDPSFRIISVLPNPVSNEGTINFVLPQSQEANLSLIDITGKFIAQIYTGFGIAGTNEVSFGNVLYEISSGTYFVVLESKGRRTAVSINITK